MSVAVLGGGGCGCGRVVVFVVVAVIVVVIVVYCVEYIILLCYLYYFNVLHVKIKPLM